MPALAIAVTVFRRGHRDRADVPPTRRCSRSRSTDRRRVGRPRRQSRTSPWRRVGHETFHPPVGPVVQEMPRRLASRFRSRTSHGERRSRANRSTLTSSPAIETMQRSRTPSCPLQPARPTPRSGGRERPRSPAATCWRRCRGTRRPGNRAGDPVPPVTVPSPEPQISTVSG